MDSLQFNIAKHRYLKYFSNHYIIISFHMGACTSRKEVRIVIIGLDQAGKTSILNKLKYDDGGTTTPTVGFNFQTVIHKKAEINIWDTGGQDKIRDLWKHYYEQVNGVLFVVDSTDENRLEEAKNELHKALGDIRLKDAFVCVAANKRDKLDKIISLDRVRHQLHLDDIAAARTWTCIGTSANSGEGLSELLNWLASRKPLS